MSERRRVHLVYPAGPAISCPDAIGRHLGDLLAARYDVVYHAWDGSESIDPSDGDILLGHAHPRRHTTFRSSLANPGWDRVVLLQPLTTNPEQMGFLRSVVPRCDVFLAITGPYWRALIATSALRRWAPRLRGVDLAVDRTEFPQVRRSTSAPGERRFVYVGGDARYKNLDYLDEIASRLPAGFVRWIGPGRSNLRYVERLGPTDFGTETGRSLVGDNDFLVTVGSSDANPATILESMAWGLVPCATAASGYGGSPWTIDLPAGDASAAAEVLERLQFAPSEDIDGLREQNFQALEEHFSWPRLAAEVIEAIESAPGPLIQRRALDEVRLLGGSAVHRARSSVVGRAARRVQVHRFRPMKNTSRLRS